MTFKKGESGNPRGNGLYKPITDALIYIGSQPFPSGNKKIGLPKKPTVWQAGARAILHEMVKGNVAAANTVLDRVEGKLAQPIIGGAADQPPVSVQSRDITLKELARRIGFLLLSNQSPEDGTETQKGKEP